MRALFCGLSFSFAFLLISFSSLAQNTFPATGNVGIGTTAPIKPLHVTGFGAFGNKATSLNATRALNLADIDAVMRILRVHPTNAPAVELISRTTADGTNVAYWDFYAQPSDKSFRIRDRVGGGSGLDRLTITGAGTIGIGTTAPHTSALLDISSTTKGLLIPRMTLAQRNAIAAPATGLLVYQTDNTPGFYFYGGTAWRSLGGGTTGSGGLATNLSNLSTPTAINSSLLPATGAKIDLGSSTNRWQSGYFEGNVWASSLSVNKGITVSAGQVSATSSIGSSIRGISTSGTGVYGENASDVAYGVHGYNKGGGTGVYGVSTAGHGVYGHGQGPRAVGVNGAGGAVGVIGSGNMYGVQGTSDTGRGVYGNSNRRSGVHGQSRDAEGVFGVGRTGVYGAGDSAGIQGFSWTAKGVYGQSPYGKAVYGEGMTGIWGIGRQTDNLGGDVGTGVYGEGGVDRGIGVWGQNYGSGDGVRGFSNAGYGVWGNSFYSIGVYGTSDKDNGGKFISWYNIGLYATTYNNASFSAEFRGPIRNTSLTYSTSDKNVKKNIQDIGSAIAILKKLKPKSYEFKEDDEQYSFLRLPEGKHYGLIAQEVEAVLPNLVKESWYVNDHTSEPQTEQSQDRQPLSPSAQAEQRANMKGRDKDSVRLKAVSYMELIPIVVKGLQEQQQEIENLNKENEELRRKADNMDELESRLQKLETLLTSHNGSSVNTSPAYLEQNIPNPSQGTTTIHYHVPEGSASVRLTLTNMKGQVVKQIALNDRGRGQVNLNTAAFAAGTYTYTLYVDGQKADSQKLVIAR